MNTGVKSGSPSRSSSRLERDPAFTPNAREAVMTVDWYQRAIDELTTIREAIRANRPLALDRLTDVARGIIGSLQRSDELVVKALSAPPGDPVVTNLVHVAILSSKLGLGLNYSGDDLERMTLAGLVHDIGIFVLPDKLISASRKLTAGERHLLEQHPITGHDIVMRAGSQYGWLATVVRQAHERWAGQGYPDRLRGRQIHEFAHVIGLCDIFDALVSHRPYRARLLPHEAIHELFQKERAAFPREILKALVEQLSLFPLGTHVRLNTGECGVVVKLNPRYPLRPVIRLDQLAESAEWLSAALVDLSRIPTMFITEALKPPTLERMQAATKERNAAGAASPVPSPATPSCSDEFASLLDSLDAIAMTIQEAVESRGSNNFPEPR